MIEDEEGGGFSTTVTDLVSANNVPSHSTGAEETRGPSGGGGDVHAKHEINTCGLVTVHAATNVSRWRVIPSSLE